MAAEEEQRKLQEEKEIAEERKRLVHKANPIRDNCGSVPAKEVKPITLVSLKMISLFQKKYKDA